MAGIKIWMDDNGVVAMPPELKDNPLMVAANWSGEVVVRFDGKEKAISGEEMPMFILRWCTGMLAD